MSCKAPLAKTLPYHTRREKRKREGNKGMKTSSEMQWIIVKTKLGFKANTDPEHLEARSTTQ